ncbi:MAG: hypothetical protein ACKVH8_13845 [Pirellulales bacterium]
MVYSGSSALTFLTEHTAAPAMAEQFNKKRRRLKCVIEESFLGGGTI